MDINGEVGETAGKIWNALSSGGPQTLAQLKKNLNQKSELLHLAVGWLARENKVEIRQEKKDLRVGLK